jgi:hypothetical protein
MQGPEVDYQLFWVWGPFCITISFKRDWLAQIRCLVSAVAMPMADSPFQIPHGDLEFLTAFL